MGISSSFRKAITPQASEFVTSSKSSEPEAVSTPAVSAPEADVTPDSQDNNQARLALLNQPSTTAVSSQDIAFPEPQSQPAPEPVSPSQARRSYTPFPPTRGSEIPLVSSSNPRALVQHRPHPEGSGYNFTGHITRSEAMSMAVAMRQETHAGKRALLTVQSGFHLGSLSPSAAIELDAWVNQRLNEGLAFEPGSAETQLFRKNLETAIQATLQEKQSAESIRRALNLFDSPNGRLGDALELLSLGDIKALQDFKTASKEQIIALSDSAISSGFPASPVVIAETIVNTGIEAMIPAHALELVPFGVSATKGAKIAGKIGEEAKDLARQAITPTVESGFGASQLQRLQDGLSQSKFVQSIPETAQALRTSADRIATFVESSKELGPALTSLRAKMSALGEVTPQAVSIQRLQRDSGAMDALENRFVELSSDERNVAVLLVFSDLEKAAHAGSANQFNRLRTRLTDYFSQQAPKDLEMSKDKLLKFIEESKLVGATIELLGVTGTLNQEMAYAQNGYPFYELSNMSIKQMLNTIYLSGISHLFDSP